MVKSYPWGKMCWRFLHRVQDLAWIGTKWVAIPLFVLSTLSEIVYTLSVGKESCIPLGIVIGFMLSKSCRKCLSGCHAGASGCKDHLVFGAAGIFLYSTQAYWSLLP
ncbi:hypothetical protein KP509_29G077400 [Ceratopteris richardii]|uniref:Uncharacterized protein n=1 Tax=Ceratopteris richardii TaxID=49495 RepID=A0A8T2RAA4_CERRI|nr:hypothetical protein KP509_29G077400 [Ceratopteris richardii]